MVMTCDTIRGQLKRGGLIVGLIAVASVTLFLSACGESYIGDWDPAWSPDGTKIAFHSNSSPRSPQIYVVDAHGRNRTNLAYGDQPSWSPDGTKIAYSTGQIYIINADGSNPTNLTSNSPRDDQPSWSPDGMKIAFTSYRDGNGEIYVMNADGKNQTNLTRNTARDDQPSWSPDGARIAFVSDRSGNREIHVMNADGSNQTDLISSPAISKYPTWSVNGTTIYPPVAENYPAWSPNGTKIAFSRARDSWLLSEIYVVNSDGTNLTNLTPAWGALTSRLTWSPDGTKIAFAGYRSGFNEMHVEIYVMDSDGSNQARLTLKPGVDSLLSFLPVPVQLLLGFLLIICLPIVVVVFIVRLVRGCVTS